jgi:hypothetical protein
MKRTRRQCAIQADEKRKSVIELLKQNDSFEEDFNDDDQEVEAPKPKKQRRTPTKKKQQQKLQQNDQVTSSIDDHPQPTTTSLYVSNTRITELPMDCLREICSYLKPFEFPRVMFVCSSFFSYCTHPDFSKFWDDAFHARYSRGFHTAETELTGIDAYRVAFNEGCDNCGRKVKSTYHVFNEYRSGSVGSFRYKGRHRIRLCESCGGKHSDGVTTKTFVKQTYGFSDAEIQTMPHTISYHRVYRSEMTLIPLCVVHRSVEQKYGMTVDEYFRFKLDERTKRSEKAEQNRLKKEKLQEKKKEERTLILRNALQKHFSSEDTIKVLMNGPSARDFLNDNKLLKKKYQSTADTIASNLKTELESKQSQSVSTSPQQQVQQLAAVQTGQISFPTQLPPQVLPTNMIASSVFPQMMFQPFTTGNLNIMMSHLPPTIANPPQQFQQLQQNLPVPTSMPLLFPKQPPNQ